jgi:dUTP pyrophosphatase
MEKISVCIINKTDFPNPSYATSKSAGMDLRANLDHPVIIRPGRRALIPTGIFIQLPDGHEAQIRPRSGLALKKGVTVLNSPGTIDADYTGEIGVILVNLGGEDFVVNHGERIAQMVVAKYESVDWLNVGDLEATERGENGFGHSGTH